MRNRNPSQQLRKKSGFSKKIPPKCNSYLALFLPKWLKLPKNEFSTQYFSFEVLVSSLGRQTAKNTKKNSWSGELRPHTVPFCLKAGHFDGKVVFIPSMGIFAVNIYFLTLNMMRNSNPSSEMRKNLVFQQIYHQNAPPKLSTFSSKMAEIRGRLPKNEFTTQYFSFEVLSLS